MSEVMHRVGGIVLASIIFLGMQHTVCWGYGGAHRPNCAVGCSECSTVPVQTDSPVLELQWVGRRALLSVARFSPGEAAVEYHVCRVESERSFNYIGRFSATDQQWPALVMDPEIGTPGEERAYVLLETSRQGGSAVVGRPLTGTVPEDAPDELGIVSISGVGRGQGRVAISGLSAGTYEIGVFDIQGRRVWGRPVNAATPGGDILSIQDFPSTHGLFLLRVTQGTRAASLKMFQ